jgi:hypothetical protein
MDELRLGCAKLTWLVRRVRLREDEDEEEEQKTRRKKARRKSLGIN